MDGLLWCCGVIYSCGRAHILNEGWQNLKQFIACAFSLMLITTAPATARAQDARPLLGAQIWIEPGQRAEDVERWFKTLADGRMPVARLFLMWNYVEREPGVWDFK